MGKRGRHKRGILPKHKRIKPKRSSVPRPLTPQERLERIQNEIYRLECSRATLNEPKALRRALIETAITERLARLREIQKKVEKEAKEK